MLIGERIILRPLKMEDLEKTNQWRNDLELIKLTQGIRFPKTLEMDKNWFENALHDIGNKNIYFGIDDLESKEIIGIIQLNSIDYISGTCDFGIVIGDSKFQGKGIGKEAMQLLFKYAFDTINLRKICLRVISLNKNATNLYHKMGFVDEGILKKHTYHDGKYHDVLLMGLFKDVFMKQK